MKPIVSQYNPQERTDFFWLVVFLILFVVVVLNINYFFPTPNVEEIVRAIVKK